MENLESIFSISAKDFLVKEQKPDESNFYKPSLEKGKDRNYTSQIIFLPYVKNPSISLIDKWTVWIQDITTGKRLNVDCPSTVGKPSLLRDAFFACRNSNNANIKNLQSLFKRKRELYSLVYIVQDQYQPEYEGKIKIFKFGQQILDILEAATNDKDEPINFFDVLNNRIFKLVINEVNVGGTILPNYKLSKFLNKKHEFVIDGKKITTKKEDLKLFLNWLKENSPELEPYQYKDWDEETRKIVVDYIKYNIPSSEIINKILKTAFTDDDLKNKNNVKKQSKISSKEVEENYDDDNDNDILDDDLNDDFNNSKNKTNKNEETDDDVIEDIEDWDELFEDEIEDEND